MFLGRFRDAVLAAIVVTAVAVPALALSEQTAPPPPAPAEASDGEASASAPKPFEQIVKLWKAQLSEDFLLRKVEREPVVYRLSTDDIIACKVAGVPEPVIEAMMKTDAPKVAPVAAAAPPVLVAPAAPAPPSLAAQANRSWDGIVKRTPGVVLFKNPWQQGSLSFREEKVSWRDADDESKSFVLAATALKEHFLVCPKDASSDEACFEWGFKTADGEERFRDVAWQRDGSPKARELFAFFEALYPGLPAAKVRVERKK